MPISLSIKNAPDHIVEGLRQRAIRNHRSLQGELMAIIEAAVDGTGRLAASEVLAQVRSLGIGGPNESTAIIRADRDRP